MPSIIDKIQGSILLLIINRKLTLRLFSAVDDNGFTEVQGGGYAPISIAAREWTLANSEAIGPVGQFVFDGSRVQTAKGAYLTAEDGSVLWAHSFDNAIEVRRKGDTVPVRPTIRTMTTVG